MAANRDPVALERAPECTAARRNLAGEKLRLAEAPGPIRDQDAMGGTGYRVFVDAGGWRKES